MRSGPFPFVVYATARTSEIARARITLAAATSRSSIHPHLHRWTRSLNFFFLMVPASTCCARPRERDWHSIRLAVHSGAISPGRKPMTTPKAKFAGLVLIAALCAGFTLGLTASAYNRHALINDHFPVVVELDF